jgi:SAM-dependent methyltransferase
MRRFVKRRVRLLLERGADAMGLREIARTQHRLAGDPEHLRRLRRRIEYRTAPSPDGFPIPPAELNFLVSKNYETDVADFFAIGRACADSVAAAVTRAGRDMTQLGSILDFGCGCGRVIRHLHRLGPQLHGTDYNPCLIEWCQRNLLFARFDLNGLQPPLRYRDGTFDLIYAFSVFTHLPEGLQFSWMAELRRVLAPGGYLFMTTHGEPYARMYLSAASQRRFEEGLLVVHDEELAGTNECGAYHPRQYVAETLASDFDVIEHIPGKIIDLSKAMIAQDSYFLSRN